MIAPRPELITPSVHDTNAFQTLLYCVAHARSRLAHADNNSCIKKDDVSCCSARVARRCSAVGYSMFVFAPLLGFRVSGETICGTIATASKAPVVTSIGRRF